MMHLCDACWHESREAVLAVTEYRHVLLCQDHLDEMKAEEETDAA